MQSNELHATLCGVATLIIIFCVIVLYFRNKAFAFKGIWLYGALFLAFAVTNVLFMVEILTDDVSVSMLCFKTESFLIMLIVILYVSLFRVYFDVFKHIKRWQLILCILFCLVFSIFTFFNPANVFFQSYEFSDLRTGVLQLDIQFNPLYFICQGALYFFLIYCVIRLFTSSIRGKIFLKQAVLMGVAILMLIIFFCAYLVGLTKYDYSNILAAVSAILLTYSAINYGILDTIPYVKRNVFSLFTDPLLVILTDNKIEAVNSAAERLFSMKSDEIVGKSLHEIQKCFPERLDDDIFEVSVLCDTPKRIRATSTALADDKGKQFGKLVMLHDVTEEIMMIEKLEYLTSFDPITGLKNAESFLEAMRNYRDNSPSGLTGTYIFSSVLANSNFLKGIATKKQKNDIYAAIAHGIQELLPSGYLLSRFSDNEFLIFSNGVQVNLNNFFLAFEGNKHTSLSFSDQYFTVDLRLGSYAIDDPKDSPEKAIEKASFAVRSAIKNGKSYELYDFNMAQQHELHKKLMASLSTIDYENEFFLEFQPIIDTANKIVVGAEALLRWTHPIFGSLSPAVFIPIFESANEMYRLGYVILDKACKALSAFEKNVSNDFKLSINISKNQINSKNLLDDIRHFISANELSPEMLDFEFTETAASENVNSVIEFCNAIHALGASVSMDDFGSGDTTLAYITDMSLDKVKLDISLSENSHLDPRRAVVLKSLLNMCNELGVSLVVEHVESIDALLNLQEQGFSLIQGYIFSRPLSEQDFLNYYKLFNNGK